MHSTGTTQPTLPGRSMFCHDNLAVLRGINSQSVDLIYLDPPFNTGAYFEAQEGTPAAGAGFRDRWSAAEISAEWPAQLQESHPALYRYLDALAALGRRSATYYLLYMAVRLLELQRVLKATGSLYVHCDPTVSHHLKLLLEALWQAGRLETEIAWKRKTSAGSPKTIANAHDVILRYSAGGRPVFNQLYRAYSPAYLRRAYHKKDARGAYRLHELVANPALGGTSPRYEYKGFKPGTRWLLSRASLAQLDAEGRVAWSASGVPYRKLYASEGKGVPLNSLWDDIPSAQGRQKVGYPTQKPVALLERIIAASSKPGALVLDPFCGAATTCIAAEKLGRNWIGIDLSPRSYELLKLRLAREVPAELCRGLPHLCTGLPRRTDLPS